MVPNTTRAVRMHRTGAPSVLQVEDVSLPALAADEVLIAVQAAGVTYPDMLVRSGTLAPSVLPHTPGFEVAGAIVAAGSAAAHLTPGTRVVAALIAGGGYAAHAVAKASAITPLPRALGAEEALAILFSGRTALLMLRHARVTASDVVFVPGATGGVGSFTVRLAKRIGARVIAGVGAPGKRESALALGADAAVVYESSGWADEVKAQTGGRGADVVFQSTGGAAGIESLRALALQGRLVLFGADNAIHPEGLSAEQVRALLAQGQTFGGFSIMRTPEEEQRAAFDELASLIESGALAVDFTRFPLTKAAEAHATLESRRSAGKIILLP